MTICEALTYIVLLILKIIDSGSVITATYEIIWGRVTTCRSFLIIQIENEVIGRTRLTPGYQDYIDVFDLFE